jgi:acyl-CoA synthetase (AMP-forming)/AMP-acid ligase II
MPPFPVDPQKQTICDVIRLWADIQPDNPAFFSDGQEPLTYAALVQLMDQFCITLNRLGLGRGDRVAIVHRGGPTLGVSMVAVASCCAVIPLDPKIGGEEFSRLLADRRINAVIIKKGDDTPARAAARKAGLPVLELVPGDSGLLGQTQLEGEGVGEPALPGISRPDDHIFVLGTSGTTSASKVAPIRHRQYLATTSASCAAFEIASDDRLLLPMPLYYAAGAFNIFNTLYSGGSVLVMPGFDVQTFFNLLETSNVTWYMGSPTFQANICGHGEALGAPVKTPSLRFIRASSSHLDPGLGARLEDLFQVPVIEAYSSSEAGFICGNPRPPKLHKLGTVGNVHGGEIKAVDDSGRQVPDGGRGEILFRGPSLFDGYENAPEATDEAFIDGWFRTGDEGFLDEDGYLVLTGRIKEIINRGGEKVSPPEVDAAMMSHPKVIEATSFAIPHPTLGEEVAAAVVIEPGATVTEQDLSRYLLDRLTGFKVPRCIVFTDEIPKSDAGKVQRHKLAEELGVGIDQSPTKGQKSNRKPSPLEYRLLMLWKWTLKNPRIGLDDNFFMLGGDSLQAVDLVLQMEKVFKCRLPVATLSSNAACRWPPCSRPARWRKWRCCWKIWSTRAQWCPFRPTATCRPSSVSMPRAERRSSFTSCPSSWMAINHYTASNRWAGTRPSCPSPGPRTWPNITSPRCARSNPKALTTSADIPSVAGSRCIWRIF